MWLVGVVAVSLSNREIPKLSENARLGEAGRSEDCYCTVSVTVVEAVCIAVLPVSVNPAESV